MKLPVLFFLPAGQSKAGVCPAIAVGSHVFSSLDIGICIMTKKANVCSKQPTCLTLISQRPVFFQNTLFENVIMLVMKQMNFTSSAAQPFGWQGLQANIISRCTQQQTEEKTTFLQ